jgi:tetratricopeptide (TPR) repeat protein
MNTIRSLGLCFALVFIILFSSQANGQKQIPYVNSVDSITLGIDYADTGAYARASALYETISENDTNYVLALLEDAVAKESNEQDSDAISLCRKGIEQATEYTSDFYNTIANVCMNEGDYTDAITLLRDSVLPKYPNIHKLYFTLGLAQYKMHKYADAITSFEKAIDLDIYDAVSHYYLGRCCLEQGRLIPALLSLQFYLVLQPQANRSYTAVGLIEQMTENKYQYNKQYSVDPAQYHDSAFTELDLLIRSKIAMNKEYPAATKINYNFIKQIQLFLEQLKYVPNSGNYWMEKYVPFFTGLQQKKFLEPYAYFIMASVSANDENLKK